MSVLINPLLDSKAGFLFPILFLEPSCYLMFIEDYRELSRHIAGLLADALLS